MKLQRVYQGIGNIYAVIRRIADGYVYNGTSFVIWNDSDIGNYDISLSSQGGDYYSADFPDVAADTYRIFYYERAGVSPAIDDLLLASETIVWRLVSDSDTNPSSDVTQLSYSSVEEADAYFNNRLYVDDWFAATNGDRQRALNVATGLIDQFEYKGTLTSPTQTLAFPRSGLYYDSVLIPSSTIPFQILRAQYEIALALIKGFDFEIELKGQSVTSRAFASVRTTYDPKHIPAYLAYGIPSALAWNYLKAFFVDSGSVTLHRVS